ncbi:hypothetical protein ACSQ67_003111 [Phaseolus vulgaris]
MFAIATFSVIVCSSSKSIVFVRGGYAEKVVVPVGQVLPIPPGVSLMDAGSFLEVACTVWSTVFMRSPLSQGENLLIHGSSSGILQFR